MFRLFRETPFRFTNRKGFSLVELAVALLVLSLLSTAFVINLETFIEERKKEETYERFKKLAKALERTMEAAIEWRKANPSWDLDYSCIPLLPNGCACSSDDDDVDLRIPKGPPFNLNADDLISYYKDAGCRIVEDDQEYVILCYDGWRRRIWFRFGNCWNAGENIYYNYYAPVAITFKSRGRDGMYNTSDDITYTFTTERINRELREQALKQLREIADALEVYFRQRLTTELENPNGFPVKEYNYKVNWFLQLCTDHPYDKCEDPDCSNINWSSSLSWGATSDLLRCTCDVRKILRNLNLPPEYATDPFGNPIFINLCYIRGVDDPFRCATPQNHVAEGPFIAAVSNGVDTVISVGSER